MNNSQPTQSTICTEITKSQEKQQKFVKRVINGALAVAQATLIGVNGNLDVHSGQPVLDVIPGMITQGIELIVRKSIVKYK